MHLNNCNKDENCNQLTHSECNNDTRYNHEVTPTLSYTGKKLVCVCKIGYYYNKTSHSCTKVLGQACIDDLTKSACQVISYASCNESCKCHSGYRTKAELSCEEVHANNCSTNDNCHGLSNSECKMATIKQCLCKSGYYYKPGSHSCEKVLGETCTNDGINSVCNNIKDANCQSNKCSCVAGFREKAYILCDEVHSNSCIQDGDCSKLAHSECTNLTSNKHPVNMEKKQECSCKVGYFYNSTSHSCDKVLGMTCTGLTTLSCNRITDASCNESCACNTGYRQKDNLSCEEG